MYAYMYNAPCTHAHINAQNISYNLYLPTIYTTQHIHNIHVTCMCTYIQVYTIFTLYFSHTYTIYFSYIHTYTQYITHVHKHMHTHTCHTYTQKEPLNGCLKNYIV